jgi:hypothetical protein
MFNPEGKITEELAQQFPALPQRPRDMQVQPPRVRQGRFRYKMNGQHGTHTVIEVMATSQRSFEYQKWKPTVEGMITTVDRKVEWTAPQSNGDCWEEGDRMELQQLSHRVLAGPRQGAGPRNKRALYRVPSAALLQR